VKLKATVGPKWDYDIIASTTLAPGTVAVLEVASFVSGFSSVAEFSTSKVGALHMEDTSPADVTGGTPSPAVPLKSLFQTDAIGLKTTLWATRGPACSRALPIHYRSDVVSSSAPDTPQLFDDPELNQLFTDTMAVVISELRAEWKQDIQQLERDSKIAKLEGKVEALLTLLGHKSGNSTIVEQLESGVVDLPRGFWKRDHAA